MADSWGQQIINFFNRTLCHNLKSLKVPLFIDLDDWSKLEKLVSLLKERPTMVHYFGDWKECLMYVFRPLEKWIGLATDAEQWNPTLMIVSLRAVHKRRFPSIGHEPRISNYFKRLSCPMNWLHWTWKLMKQFEIRGSCLMKGKRSVWTALNLRWWTERNRWKEKGSWLCPGSESKDL